VRHWSWGTITLLWAGWAAVLIASSPWLAPWLEERAAGVGVAIHIPDHLWGRALLLLAAALIALVLLLGLFLPPAAVTAAWLWLRRGGSGG
jgi:hypothetical protein